MSRVPARRTTRRVTAAATSTAIIASTLAAGVVFAPEASASVSPWKARGDADVTADALPTAQINGVAWDQEIVGNTVYVGGSFSKARPAGAAAGTNESGRSNLMSYSLSTGEMTSWSPQVNGQILAVTASPDGSRIYIGGDFTSVNGQARSRIAAFDTATGQLIESFRPPVGYQVRSIVATGSKVYVGGNFQGVGSQPRQNFAAFQATNGALLNWAPTADREVYTIDLTEDGQYIIAGGKFESVNGTPTRGLAKLDASTGELMSWPVLMSNGGKDAGVTSVKVQGTTVYGTNYHYGAGGNAEGAWRADVATGALIWIEDAHGDTYDTFPGKDSAYTVGHAHYSGNVPGGFPQYDPWRFQHAMAFTKEAVGTNLREVHGYYNWGGQPSPSIVQWFPTFTPGSATGQSQAGWTVEGNDDYVVIGGEFPRVNGQVQQGLVRFAKKSIAPNKQKPEFRGNKLSPTLQAVAPGSVKVSWLAGYDMDDLSLTYEVVRTPGGVRKTVDAESNWWHQPGLSFVDTGLTPGSTYTYEIRATDSSGNKVFGTKATITAQATVARGEYGAAVLADEPAMYWPLDEQAGATAVADHAGGYAGVPGSALSFGADGAVEDGSAAALTGSSNSRIVTDATMLAPTELTTEAWFKTTSANGRILGFGDLQTANSGRRDRQLYLDGGRVQFGLESNGTKAVSSARTVNDNEWHHAVATLSGETAKLYVDGVLVGKRHDILKPEQYVGYWRIGADNGTSDLVGSVDEVALYPRALSAEEVDAHYVSSGRTSQVPVAPNDAYGAAVFAADPDVYWRLSDTNGSVAKDAGPFNSPGTYYGGTTRDIPGALKDVSDAAVALNGNDGLVSSTAPFANPQVFTTESWFRTTTTRGGKIMGFGNQASGLSNNYDRHTYMLDDGRLVFGVWTGQTQTVESPKAYNDGQWHHVATSLSADGMKMYVDGELAGTNPNTLAENYNGYWRIGGDRHWGGASSEYFDGSVDEFAVYSRALTNGEIAQHHNLGTGIVPNAVPTAAFTHEAAHLAVSFDATGSNDADGTIASYEWNFGDGTTATGATANHTYANNGSFEVSLVVTDDDGATNFVSQQVTVAANEAPAAVFSHSTDDLQVSVDAAGSTDPDGTVASYDWAFGDGETSTGPTATHLYSAAGNYEISLTVTDNDGATTVVTKQVTVSEPLPNQSPTAAFAATVNDLSVAFDAAGSSDPDGSIVGYRWAFGDAAGGTASEAQANYAYAAAGTYQVTLTVTDDQGASGSFTQDVTVVAPPVATTFAADAFGRDTTNGFGSADVGGLWSTANAGNLFRVNGGTGQITMTRAGTGSTIGLNNALARDLEASVDVAFDKAPTGSGVYESLLVRRNGNSDYRLRVRPMPTGTQVLLSRVINGTEVVLANSTQSWVYQPGQVIRMKLIAEGGGTTELSGKVWRVGSTEPTTWQVRANDSTAALQGPGGIGIYSYLSGSATNAPVVASVDNLYVGGIGAGAPVNQAPVAAFTATGDGLRATVDATSSTDADGAVATYGWDFGDGTTGAGATAAHTYGTAGTYQVTLTVTDDKGATHRVTHPVTVSAPVNVNPVAAFESQVAGLTVSVDASASTDPDGSVESYSWSFGDGSAAVEGRTATHAYQAPGTYEVTLTVTDSAGATATVMHLVMVETAGNQAPIADFSVLADKLTVNVDASSSSDPDGTIASLNWDFGGQAASGKTTQFTFLAAGTYPVTLTVTDDHGLSTSVTKSVTVTDPAAPVSLLSDSFERIVPAGFGTADIGGVWTPSGSSAGVSVVDGAGIMQLPTAGAQRTMYLNAVGTANTDVTVKVGLDKDPSGSGTYVTVSSRRVGTTEYRLKVRFLPGSTQLILTRVVNGVETNLSSRVLSDVAYHAGDKMQLRFETKGGLPTTLAGKIWSVGSVEPVAWQVSASDSTAALQGPGGLGLQVYLSTSSANAPVLVRFDDLLAVEAKQ